MKVKTLRQHDNPFGDKYRKAVGDEYEHPQPAADIHFGYVEPADKGSEAKASEADANSSDTDSDPADKDGKSAANTAEKVSDKAAKAK